MTEKKASESIAEKVALLPQEERLEVVKREQKLVLGIPKETQLNEKRVALTPQGVALIVNNGHEVIVQSEVGKHANYSDNDYSEAGAVIVEDAAEVFKANTIVKVAPPSLAEVNLMHDRQVLFSTLQISIQSKEVIGELMRKRVSAIAWECIKDSEGTFPVVRAMAEIAGNTSILIAAEMMNNANKGVGLMLGGISGVAPTEVVILGAGTVAEFATRAALGLGANVKVFDNSTHRLRRLQNAVGERVYNSMIEPNILTNALLQADVAIGAIRSPLGRTPCVVTDEMVSQMKQGAVIVDVSIDQGGCFETSELTTHADPTFLKHEVNHYCVPNIPSRVSRTASRAMSNIFAPTFVEIGKEGGYAGSVRRIMGLRNGVYLHQGILTNEVLAKKFNLKSKSIDLLLAAF